MAATDIQDGVPCPRTDFTEAAFTLTEDAEGRHQVEAVLTFAHLGEPCPDPVHMFTPEYTIRGYYEPAVSGIGQVWFNIDLDVEMTPQSSSYAVDDEDGRQIESGGFCTSCIAVDFQASTITFDVPGPTEPPMEGVWLYSAYHSCRGVGVCVSVWEPSDAIPNTLDEDATLFASGT